MDKSKEVEEKTRKLSAKLGALFVKELLIKQYKMNYLQKLRAQSQAFNTWKKAYINIAEKKKGLNKSRWSNEMKVKGLSKSVVKAKVDPNMIKNLVKKHKMLMNCVKNQNLINISMQKEKRQIAMQSKLCRLGIGCKILATAIGNKIMKAKSKAFDSMKLHYFAFDKNNSNADEGFHLFKANDQSEIIAVSDHDDDGSCDGDRHMSNILSKMDGEDNSNTK